MGTVTLTDLPDDFVVLLTDLICADDEIPIPAVLTTVTASLAEHDDEFFSEVSFWDERDLIRVQGLLDAVLHNRPLPPLVVDEIGHLLRDGYHRMAAYRLVGRTEAEFIVLNDYKKKAVTDEAS